MGRAVRVAVPRPVPGTFSYNVPPRLQALAVPGARALVEFGRQKVAAFLLADDPEPAPASRALKDVLEILDPEPILPPDLLDLGQWLASYYHHPLGEVLASFLPPAARATSRVEYAPLDGDASALSPEAAELWARIARRGALAASAIPQGKGGLIEALLAAGCLERRWKVAPPAPAKSRRWALLSAEAPAPETLGGNRARLAELLAQLRDGPVAVDELRARGLSTPTLQRAEEAGWIAFCDEPPRAASADTLGYAADGEVTPTPSQREALGAVSEALDAQVFSPILLQGVTGSGKTEVYLRAVEDALARGRSALVLVPEISLTPQLVGRFASRLGNRLAVLHSGLAPRERALQWEAARRGRARVVVGTRSAVFAPLADLGLVVVDEEHDPGYKQEEGLRYHAKHAALMRAKAVGAAALLGSATPDLETLALANAGRYRHILLAERVGGAVPPAIRLVDLRPEESRLSRRILISPTLRAAVDAALEKGEQALIFHNRRGFSPALYCPACEAAIECASCSVPMTLHRKRGGEELLCHYCGLSRPVPPQCPSCGGELVKLGAGTQKVEEAVRELWPAARVARLDRDTAAQGAGLSVLRDFARGGADILVGTQLVAKGHHFPMLTVVGALSADDSLHFPDYRAAERTFQTLVQVAGRAGRAERPGTVFIQTRNPHHPVLLAVASGNFDHFAQGELEERRAAGYPPYRRVALLRCSGPSEVQVEEACRREARWLAQKGKALGVEVLGPAPAPIERLRGQFRHHLLLRAPGADPGPLQTLLRAWAVSEGRKKAQTGEARFTLDVDPVSLL